MTEKTSHVKASTDQNAVHQTQNGPPKRFLRKGEGLKRFAAYKPPLPSTVKKVERRQTFVRFRLDQKSSNAKREPPTYFIPPEILNDDSINLSTEIPKIAPPKIIHTPIRPNRHALGTITNESSIFSESRINGNIDSLFKKIEEKKSSLEDQAKLRSHYNDINRSFDEHDSESDKQQDQQEYEDQQQRQKQQHQQQQHHHQSYTPPPSPPAPTSSRVTCRTRKVNQVNDLSAPTPGSCILALGKQIQQIEASVNELKEKIRNCECGAFASAPPSPPKTRRRPTTRAAARAAKSKTTTSDPERPSAPADNLTANVINNLLNEVAELRAKFDEFNIKN